MCVREQICKTNLHVLFMSRFYVFIYKNIVRLVFWKHFENNKFETRYRHNGT